MLTKHTLENYAKAIEEIIKSALHSSMLVKIENGPQMIWSRPNRD